MAAAENPDGPYAGAGEKDDVVDWVNEETMAGAPKQKGDGEKGNKEPV